MSKYTDLYNEIDDQIALAYVLKSKDALNLEAVTIAPFTKGEYNTKTSIDKSYEVAKKVFKMCNEQNNEIIFKGATEYFTNDSNQTNEAVNKIIQIAKKNDKTYILAIGCLTNVALVIKKYPKIISKISIIWLGTNFLFGPNQDFNFRQDVEAVKLVMNSGVDLTIMPCSPITSNLMTSIYELNAEIGNKSELCDYLCYKFYNRYWGPHKRYPIWDISVIAFLINEDWFKTMEVSCPVIKDDNTFIFKKSNHKIKFVNYLNANPIFENLFETLKK